MIARWRTLSPYWRHTTIRLALLPLILFLLCNIIFLFVEVIYERPNTGFYGLGVTEEQIEALEDEFGLNDSALDKYRDFWSRIATLDFGESMLNQRPARDILNERWASSAQLLIMSSHVGAAVAVGVGWAGTVRRARLLVPTLSALLAGVPVFYVAREAVLLPADWWEYASPTGDRANFWTDPLENLKQFGHAAVPLGILAGVWSARVTRAYLGGTSALTVRRIVAAAGTAVVDMLPFLITGLILFEWRFSIPGMGTLLMQSAIVHDTDILEVCLIIVALIALIGWAFAPPTQHADDASPSPGPQQLIRRPLVVAGAIVAAFYLVLGVAGPWIAADNPLAFDKDALNQMPSWDHWFGTDFLGRDTLDLVLAASRPSLEFTALVLLGGFVPGLAIAALTRAAVRRSARRGLISDSVEWLADLVRALPLLPVVFLFVATFGRDRSSTVFAVAILVFAVGLRTIHPHSLTTVVGAAALSAAIAISAHAMIGVWQLDGDYASWGSVASTWSSRNESHAPEAFFAAAITTFTAGFLLIRTALDDLDPPRLYER